MEWKKFHDSCNELHTYITGLETKVKGLEDLLNGFMAEEDVKSLPSYKLLLMQYVPSNNKKVAKTSSTTLSTNSVFDPMYAPPTNRRNKPVVSVKSPTSSVSKELPTNLLFDTVAPQSETTKVVDINVSEDEFVFTVELNGVNYYFHDNYLYDTSSYFRVGKLTNDCFQINDVTVSLGPSVTVSSLSDYDGYFKDDHDKVYQKLLDNVVQSVGRYVDGEIHAWA